MEFEWDTSKNRTNQLKHGVSFIEAVETFFDPKGIQLSDTKHSNAEKRHYWVGKSKAGKVLTTRFVRRGTKIRIIGSAYWRKFKKIYETTKI